MNKDDYPAAHSMDTEWFAVDEHGHVAVFSTSEQGAVPREVYKSDFYFSGLPLCDQTTNAEYYVDDLVKEPGGKILRWTYKKELVAGVRFLREVYEESSLEEIRDGVFRCLVLLSNEAPFSLMQETNENRGILSWLRPRPKPQPTFLRVPNTKHILGWSDSLSKSQLRGLIDQELVLRAWIGGELQAQRFGFYVFDHRDEFGLDGPYIKRAIPEHPVQYNEFADSIREEIGNLQIPGADFSRDRAIQPREYFECESYGDDWIDLSGKVYGEVED